MFPSFIGEQDVWRDLVKTRYQKVCEKSIKYLTLFGKTVIIRIMNTSTRHKPILAESKPVLQLRASKLGGCVRGYVMDLRDGEPEPSAQQQIYFAVGKALEPVIMAAAGFNPNDLLDDMLGIEVDLGGGVVVTGHPDAFLDGWVVECKTMRSSVFKRVVTKGFEAVCPQYMIQGGVYCEALGAVGVRYLVLDKDASLLHDVRYESWEMAVYWEQAVANAEKIQQWVGKERLPGKAEAQPYYYCLPNYCLRHSCRFNHIHKIKST